MYLFRLHARQVVVELLALVLCDDSFPLELHHLPLPLVALAHLVRVKVGVEGGGSQQGVELGVELGVGV